MDLNIEARQRVHALIDQLPPGQVAALEGLLLSMVDPLSHLAPAPVIEAASAKEEITPMADASEDFEGFSFEQVVAECGFTMDQIRDTQTERGPAKKIRFEPNVVNDTDSD